MRPLQGSLHDGCVCAPYLTRSTLYALCGIACLMRVRTRAAKNANGIRPDLRSRSPLRACARDGGDAVMRGETGDQIDQKSRSAVTVPRLEST